MKDKIVLSLIVGLFIAPCIMMGQTKVDFSHSEIEHIKDGHNNCIPIVTSDGDDVNLKCDSTLYNVDVVIKDQYGNVMHQSTQTIGPSETTIYVPSTDGDSEKTTIDLYYDRRHLSGYFEE